MYTNEHIQKMATAVLPLQRKQNPKPYVTVRQCALMWKMSVGGAHRVLRAMVSRDEAEQTGRGHYHIYER